MSLLAKKYRAASFKGIPFKVDSTDTEVGRRVVTHEYPLRDTPGSRDLGRKAEGFTIDGYVLGANYEAERDALEDACKSEGPGTLIHPYKGSKEVVCTGCRIRESKSELGIAYFSLTFVENGKQVFPTANVNPKSKLKTTIEDLQGVSSTAFEKVYTVADSPSFVSDSAEESITGFADIVDGEASKVGAVSGKLADYTYQIRQMRATVGDIAQTPSSVSANFKNSLNALLALAPGGGGDMKRALNGTLSFGAGVTENSDTESRIQEYLNAKAMRDLNKQLVVGLLSSEASDRTYASHEDAKKDRDEILDLIDEVLDETNDDDVFLGFQKLRNELVKAVPGDDQELPNIVTIQIPAVAPSLVLAYDTYENLDLENDIVQRNNISNPAFIPPARDLKILKGV